MVSIRFMQRQPDGTLQARTVQTEPGHSVMQAAVAAGIDGIPADCGGVLVCATCHVYVAPEWATRLPPASDDENGMLEFTTAPRHDGSRLSCQITVAPELDGLTVEVPERQY